MTLELKPIGHSCNLACTYCYQVQSRESGNSKVSKTYDLEKMMEVADNEYDGYERCYTIFGGEALLIPFKDLETLCRESYYKYGTSSMQTNGSLITDKHIEMFKKYNVTVGVSIDGANELNGLRIPASNKQDVNELTQATMNNIMKMREHGISVGIIICTHKLNATKEKLPRLINFIEWLESLGIQGGNIHMTEIDSPIQQQYSLTPEENDYAFLKLAEYFYTRPQGVAGWLPFSEMKALQEGNDSFANCVWSSCDPLNTQAVFGIEANGQKSNCGMASKDGIEWTKAEHLGSGRLETAYMRDIVLYNTPQEANGCEGCRFFLLCNGNCNGSAIDGDWRNKTMFCGTIKKLFSYYEDIVEKEGKVPFSKRADRKLLEGRFIENAMTGRRLSMSQLELMKTTTVRVGRPESIKGV